MLTLCGMSCMAITVDSVCCIVTDLEWESENLDESLTGGDVPITMAKIKHKKISGNTYTSRLNLGHIG